MVSISELRKPRIFGIAIFDLVSSIIGTIIIFVIAWRYHFREKSVLPFILAGILLSVPIGIVFHVIFGTNTTLNHRLGLSNRPEK